MFAVEIHECHKLKNAMLWDHPEIWEGQLRCILMTHRDHFMVGEHVRFLFTSCEESKSNE